MSDLFRRLEESLWIEETRFDYGYMNNILTIDFFEFGRSGKIYTRTETLSHPYQEILAKIPLEDLKLYDISGDIKQITYISEVGKEKLRANRSSIWVFRDNKWQLRFHQGTPCL
jgi:hypothetical protein